MGDSLEELVAGAMAASAEGSWSDAMELSERALSHGLARHLSRDTMVELARRYVGAALESGQFLFDGLAVPEAVLDRWAALEAWCQSSDTIWLLDDERIKAMHEILLLAPDASDMARGQLASALRKVARPDLSIRVSDAILEHSRLNYYAQATKGAALVDLGQLDAAIDTLLLSLRDFHPTDGRDRPMNALSRALRLRGIQTGDSADLEDAADIAASAWALYPSLFSYRTYEASLVSLGDQQTLDDLTANREFTETTQPRFSPQAIEQALEVIARLSRRTT